MSNQAQRLQEAEKVAATNPAQAEAIYRELICESIHILRGTVSSEVYLV